MLHHFGSAGHTFYSPHAPSGGPTLLFMLELLDLYSLNFNSDLNLTYHRLVESFKFAYSERTRLGDPHCDDALDQKCLQNSQQILQAQRNMLKLVLSSLNLMSCDYDSMWMLLLCQFHEQGFFSRGVKGKKLPSPTLRMVFPPLPLPQLGLNHGINLP